MMEFVQNKGVNLPDFQRMSHPESKFKSLKLTLSVPDYMFLYDSSQWPDGVRIEKYRNGPNKFRNTIIAMANKTLKNKLSICTYNVRGYNSTKHGYIIELLSKCTILLIEEHWLNDTII